MVGMIEDAAGPGEAAGWNGQRKLWRDLLFQGLDQDSLQPSHVDEINVQGPAAGGIEAPGCVAFPEAQELVSLSHLGSGERAVEEALSEFGHRRAQSGGAALDPVGRPGGVG